MVLFLKLLSFLILTCWFFFCMGKIIKGRKDSILFVICVFYFFFGMPLIFDLVRGLPGYLNRPGFYYASRDNLTSIIYSIFVAIVPLFWWKTRFQKQDNVWQKIHVNGFLNRYRYISIPLLFILLISPLILWCFSPDPIAYLRYGNTTTRGFSEESKSYHSYIISSVYLSILAASVLFYLKKKELLLFFMICLAPFLFISVWLNGKRLVFFLVIILISYLLFNKRILLGARLIIYSIVIGLTLLLFTNIYQTSLRADVVSTAEEKYEISRIDFGRDDVTKLAIYAELSPDLDILEYRGQSLLFNTLLFIPRKWWEDKPYPYPKYATSAMFLVEPRLWSWGLTTSVIDSAIADFGWLGFLLGPIFITYICRIGEKKDSPLANPLTSLVACLFLVLHLPAFLPVFLLWLLIVIKPNRL